MILDLYKDILISRATVNFCKRWAANTASCKRFSRTGETIRSLSLKSIPKTRVAGRRNSPNPASLISCFCCAVQATKRIFWTFSWRPKVALQLRHLWMPAIKRGTLGALKARSSTYATWRKSGMEDTSWRGLMSNMIRARGAKASPCGMEVWTCSGVGCTAFPKHSHRTWWPHTNIKMLAHSSGNPCSCMFSMAKPGWTKSKHLEKSKEARTSWFSNASLSCLHAVATPRDFKPPWHCSGTRDAIHSWTCGVLT